MSAGAILSIDNGAEVQAGDVLARIPRESSKTRDITGGLPRVAELFEARKPKDFAVIAESDGRVEFGNDYKAKRRIKVIPIEGDAEPVEWISMTADWLITVSSCVWSIRTGTRYRSTVLPPCSS